MTPPNNRLPTLLLTSADPRAPTFQEVTQADQLYPLAAWVFHHGDALDAPARNALLAALVRVWPVRGRPKTRYARATAVAVFVEFGLDKATIARKLNVTTKYVNELLRDARRVDAMRAEPDSLAYGIECGQQREGGPKEPYDPATLTGRIWMAAGQNDAAVDDFDFWATADAIAADEGYNSFVDMQHEARTSDLPHADAAE